MIRNKLVYFFLLLSIVTSCVLYKDSFRAYFFQDDWFTLRISNAKNVSDFLQFFIPRKDIIYYRPLGMQTPFFLIKSFFGLNPLIFHIFSFITHSVNVILVFYLIRLIKKDIFAALLSAFMYAVSAVHYIPMFWSATYAFVLGPTFFFLTFILFLLSESGKKNYYLFSWIIFSLGLLVNEMVSVFIPLMLIYQIYSKKIDLRKIIPYSIPLIFIFLIRFIIFTPPLGGSYQIGVGKQLLLNLRGYIMWSFNWPEEMTAQFMKLFKVNPKFIREFGIYLWSFLFTFLVSLIFMIILPLLLIILKRGKSFIALFFFSLSWFMIGLLPVIFFIQHSFSYYLPISLVGLLLLINSVFSHFTKIIYNINKPVTLILVLVLLVNWAYSTFITIDFNSNVHWAPRRAAQSELLVGKAGQYYPPGKLNSNFIFVRPSSENRLSLNNQDAFRVLYNKPIVTIYRNVYGKISL